MKIEEMKIEEKEKRKGIISLIVIKLHPKHLVRHKKLYHCPPPLARNRYLYKQYAFDNEGSFLPFAKKNH